MANAVKYFFTNTNSKMIYLLAIFSCLCSFGNAVPLEKTMVDMSYVYDETTQNFPIHKKFNMTVVLNGTLDNGIWVQSENIFTATHMGTHTDAPSHFILGGMNVDDIPVSHMMAPAAVINITQKASQNRDAGVAVEDLEEWERVIGKSLNGTVVLIKSGWGKKWHNRAEYLGTTEEDMAKLHYPGFSEEAAQWLVDNREIIGVGSDTISLDKGIATDFVAHRILHGRGLYGLENVANVELIPIHGATLYIMPMKIGRASGAPTRLIATYPNTIYDHLFI